MSITADKIALVDHVNQACVAAQSAPAPLTLTRPATVVGRLVEGFWQGSFPLVEIKMLRRQVVLITGNNSSPMGQKGLSTAQLYLIRIRSQTDTDTGFGPDAAEHELEVVEEAIEAWFSVIAHRCLPDGGGTKRVQYAGPPFDFRGTPNGPYTSVDGQLGQVLAGTVSVLSFPREST